MSAASPPGRRPAEGERVLKARSPTTTTATESANVLVVITSYRVRELTLECLESLEAEVAQNPGMRVGICDNGNEDDTAAYLQKAIDERGWEDWAYVKTVMPNRGFSGGNNAILRDALASSLHYDYFLLLNADTIVRPGAIGQLLDMIERNDEIGIVGPKITGLAGDVQVSCFRYITPISELLRAARTGPITRALGGWEVPIAPEEGPSGMDWTSFCCALVRRAVLEDIGILDEGYYLYFDDVDYCRAARQAGWKIAHQPGAEVMHLEGQSNPVVANTARRERRPKYWYRSRAHYFSKFYGKAGLLCANLLWSLGRMISLAREVLGRKEPHVCEHEWLDIWTGFPGRIARELTTHRMEPEGNEYPPGSGAGPDGPRSPGAR